MSDGRANALPCPPLATPMHYAPKPCGTVVYMADSPNGDRSNVQDFSEGKLNGGHERSGIMIWIHLDRLIYADSVTTILPANYPPHESSGPMQLNDMFRDGITSRVSLQGKW